MAEFLIFNKVDKIYFTRSLVINSLALIFISPILFSIFIEKKELTELERMLAIFSCILVFFGLITKLFIQTSYEKLKGNINGKLKLEDDKIEINGKEYLLEDIKKIEIFSEDFRGKWKSKGKSDFSNALSNGVDNGLKLVMENEKDSILINFLQTEKREIHKAKNQLIKYYKAGKIHWLKLIEILDINDYDEIQKFKSTIR